MRAFVLVDLGFGDAGKGLMTDFLVRESGATCVVRYNGGAQAGHNVVTSDGRHHTFAQFGAGTFVPGVRTFLSRNVVVHPTALLREEAHLRSVGVHDAFERLRISASALIITPYHQALNRLRELARGDARHGSCGVGVGEAVAHSLARSDDAIRMSELANRTLLRRKLQRIREYAWSEVADPGAPAEAAIFHRPDAIEQWVEQVQRVAPLVGDDDSWLGPAVVFEGAQGVLLDERYGFPPYTTWGRCTAAPALELIDEVAPRADVTTIGVLRTHAVRHGAGPLPTEADLVDAPSEHNAFNTWQGAVRRGWFDGVLARAAAVADGGVDALAITHLDWLRRLERWTYCDEHRPDVDAVRPVLRHCAANEEQVLETIEAVVGKRVALGSRGPTAADVFIRPENQVEVSRGADRRREVG